MSLIKKIVKSTSNKITSKEIYKAFWEHGERKMKLAHCDMEGDELFWDTNGVGHKEVFQEL